MYSIYLYIIYLYLYSLYWFISIITIFMHLSNFSFEKELKYQYLNINRLKKRIDITIYDTIYDISDRIMIFYIDNFIKHSLNIRFNILFFSYNYCCLLLIIIIIIFVHSHLSNFYQSNRKKRERKREKERERSV